MSMFDTGAVLARPLAAPAAAVVEQETIEEKPFFESMQGTDAMLEAVSAIADINYRQEAAAAVLQWVSGGDADFDELDALLFGLAGGDEGEEKELNDTEYGVYEKLSDLAAEFIAAYTSADMADVEMMGEDDDSAERVFVELESALGDSDSDELLGEFAARQSMMLEATKKVIRDGKVKYIKTRKRKRRMTAAQRAALKKARRKSSTGAAKAARKKAMRMRKSRGM